jgi:thioredoxin reductase
VATIAILGAGPIGLEAALAAAARGHQPVVYEAHERVGGNVRRWGHVRMFTPWSWNVSPRARAAVPGLPGGDALPTGDELAGQVLERLAQAPALAGRLRLGVRVVGVAREGLLKHEHIGGPERSGRPFRLLLRDRHGTETIERADAVIDATGTYGNPNRLGDGGIDAVNERAFEERIERWLPDVERRAAEWAGRTILLTGAGHSAQSAARALARFAAAAPGTRVVWAVRSPAPDWGAVPGDPLPERAALARDAAALAAGASADVEVRPGRVTEALHERGGRMVVTLGNGAGEEVEVDRVLALNGAVGDPALYRQLQVHECYATAGPMKLAAALLAEGGGGGDCLSIGQLGPDSLLTPEPGFFILGAKSYGRNSQFLLRTGWRQVDDLFGSLL